MQRRRPLKVLLVGHACGVDLGSEPGLTWNWAHHLSASCEVWVLAHPRYQQSVEAFLSEHPNANLHIVWTQLPPAWDPWKPDRGEDGIRLHYLLWQHVASLQAKRLQRLHQFSLVHHVSWNTISAPPWLWSLPLPFVWGPIGGGQTAPSSFRRYFGPGWRKEAVRSLRVGLLPWSPLLRRAVQKSALLLSTNRETAQALEKAGAERVRLFPDNGIPPGLLPQNLPERKPETALTLLWAGRLERIKGLPLALEALARVKSTPVRMLVAGDGPMDAPWRELTRTLGVQGSVEFLGRIPWREMPRLFLKADAFFCSSLRESFSSVIVEAMAHGLPVLTPAIHGAGTFVPDEAGIKAPVVTPEETVSILAQGIETLARRPDLRRNMGEAAYAYAKTQTWDRRAEQMLRWYHEVLDAHCAL
ncbi:MAG: glycosyltransferase family 4 protein [Methanothrix sp.]|nr:glycosyltransferase family 4 protein [Methanothrix sp.]